MKIYELLPKTNCKKCGEQGCFAFAAKLLNGEKTLQDCPPMGSKEYNKCRLQIEKMVSPIRLK